MSTTRVPTSPVVCLFVLSDGSLEDAAKGYGIVLKKEDNCEKVILTT